MKKNLPSHSEALIRELEPSVPDDHARNLASVWDEIVHRIIESMLDDQSENQHPELHINVRADMIHHIAKLTHFITMKVVEDRVAGRGILEIDPEVEQSICFSPEGTTKIMTTAQIFHERFWKKMMETRWLPKSKRAIENDSSPPQAKALAVKPVQTQHYISRWLIRDHWAQKDKAIRWRRNGQRWSRSSIGFGTWGHRQRLWSDRLEAYFSLLEGDAKGPINKLLCIEPLNPPQQQAFVAFLIIHILRNPSHIENLRSGTRTVVDAWASDAGMSTEEAASKAFDGIFSNHDIYKIYAAPLLESRWTIVSSKTPIFVMPDSFCATGMTTQGLRFVVPISPFKCFVTLPITEQEKRIVPYQYAANESIAMLLASLLAASAKKDFLAHPDLEHAPRQSELSLEQVLISLQATVLNKNPHF